MPNLYMNLTKEEASPAFLTEAQNPIGGAKEIKAGSYSDFLGWTVLAIQPMDTLLGPVKDMRNLICLIGVIIICLTIFITYVIAKSISAPIQVVHNRMKNFRLGEPQSGIQTKSTGSILEIEGLNRIFNDMCIKLNESLDTIVSIRAHDVQAKMLAMQSQMNPHFLYNTLSIIKIVGKEGDNESVVKMCADLSLMLRYISDSNPAPVSFKDEIDHTLHYLGFMKIRHQDKLNYHIDIPLEMHDIQVPRLILQPLVENSMKFAAEVCPPWDIRIKGTIENGAWAISVADGGMGFTVEKIQELQKKFESYNPELELPTTQINGMSLINIIARLKLLYREKAVFRIEQPKEGGSLVIIGGLL